MKTLIIEKPSLAPLSGRIGWAFFTTIFWIVWLYLWMPLITLVLWWWGIHLFDKFFLQMSLNELVGIEHLFIIYGLVIAVVGGSLLIWATTELIRFQHNHQRQQPTAVTPAEMAAFTHIPTEKVIELTAARKMVMHHDEHGRLLSAEIA